MMKVKYIFDPRLGIYLYQNAIIDSDKSVELLEKSLSKNAGDNYRWSKASVGDGDLIANYRECQDFKLKENDLSSLPTDMNDLALVFNSVKNPLVKALHDYETRFNIRMDFMESTNFVKYKEGEFFSTHADHGFSYNCTVSSIAYLNDDYEGGELYFPYLGFKIRPKAGDIILFPSSYIYSHGSYPITSGLKYVAVTMFDYNDRTHKGFRYGYNLDGSEADPEAGKNLRFPDKKPDSQVEPLGSDYQFTAI
jgi:hypothetical protein